MDDLRAELRTWLAGIHAGGTWAPRFEAGVDPEAWLEALRLELEAARKRREGGRR